MLQITIFEEGESPRVLSFPEGERVRFGRAPDNDLVLCHNSISRAHGEFVHEGGHWCLLDRGSRAGMIVVRGASREHLGQGLPGSRVALDGGEDVLILGTRLHVDIKGEDTTAMSAPPSVVSRLAETQLAAIPFFEHPSVQDGRNLQLLLELAKDLNGESELGSVLSRVGCAVFAALDHATQVSVCVPDPSGAYRPAFAVLRDGAQVAAHEISLPASIVERAVHDGSAMLFQTSDGDCDPRQSMLAREITSSMAVPLLGAKGTVGVMVVDNRTLGSSFCEADLDLLIVLANSAAFALERAQLDTQIELMFEGFVDTAVTAIEARDPTTSGHSRRVASLSLCLAEVVSDVASGEWASTRFDDPALTEIAYSAMLHDFGKVGIPECLLGKAGRLHPEQVEAIRARFALIAARCESLLYAELIAARPDRPAADLPDEVAARAAPLRRDLARVLEQIRDLNHGAAIDDASAESLRAFAARSFLDDEGRPQPFLTPLELESLSIPHGTLTSRERSDIERHVRLSFDVVRQIPWPAALSRVPDLVHAHHEKLDGSGYPRGLRSVEIPVEARILTVADMFDAVTACDRPYRRALTPDAGLEFLRMEAGAGRIDRDLVDLFAAQRVFLRSPTSPKLKRLLQLPR